MLNYLINSFKQKMARCITQKHPMVLDTFAIPGVGNGQVQFANWENPLVEKKVFTKETVDFFKKFLHPGDFAIDIGANIGHTTVQMALATGPTGPTLGFDPYVFEILQRNATLNPELVRIGAHNLAISTNFTTTPPKPLLTTAASPKRRKINTSSIPSARK